MVKRVVQKNIHKDTEFEEKLSNQQQIKILPELQPYLKFLLHEGEAKPDPLQNMGSI